MYTPVVQVGLKNCSINLPKRYAARFSSKIGHLYDQISTFKHSRISGPGREPYTVQLEQNVCHIYHLSDHMTEPICTDQQHAGWCHGSSTHSPSQPNVPSQARKSDAKYGTMQGFRSQIRIWSVKARLEQQMSTGSLFIFWQKQQPPI